MSINSFYSSKRIGRRFGWQSTLQVGVILTIITVFNSCSQKYYVPNQVFVSNVSQSQDFTVAGGVCVGDQVQGLGLQSAYSPFSNFAIQGTFSLFNATEIENPSHGYLWDVGLGSYFTSGNLNYEFYGGYGQGFNHQFFGLGTWGDFNLSRYYIQGAFSLPTEYFHFFAGLRVALLYFNSGTIIVSDEFKETGTLEFIRANAPFSMLEPTWGFRVGRPGIYLVMQRTTTFSQLSQRGLTANMASIGVQVTPELFKKPAAPLKF